MRAGVLRSMSQKPNMQTIDRQPVTVRGQPTEMVITEHPSQGYPLRTAVVVFEGISGPAMVTISGSVEEWNQDEIGSFGASMR